MYSEMERLHEWVVHTPMIMSARAAERLSMQAVINASLRVLL